MILDQTELLLIEYMDGYNAAIDKTSQYKQSEFFIKGYIDGIQSFHDLTPDELSEVDDQEV